MGKLFHEIRDPLYAFVKFTHDERKVIDSRPFQRLRHIHQLAMTSLVYPGATHKRFEHSLGVMELSGRVFDTITHPDNILSDVRELFLELKDPEIMSYWRTVLRIAALCHDLGHLPFSHAAESDLLPEGWDHERLTMEIIQSGEMKDIWNAMIPSPKIEHIVKLALGPKKAAKYGIKNFTDWEAILSELIVGDAFGVDRMDYLLRDSHHTGVAYGRFDHYRLIDTLRILTLPPTMGPGGASKETMLGVEEGGLQSAEALLLARYFMFTQVYCHPVRRIYDIHLKDFLASWLPEGVFSINMDEFLSMTDNEVISALRHCAFSRSGAGCEHAIKIIYRQHFKELYRRYPDDIAKNPEAVESVYKAVKDKFGEQSVRKDLYIQKGNSFDFPVLKKDERIASSYSLSLTLQRLPPVAVGYVFIERSVHEEAREWLERNRMDILKPLSARGRESNGTA